MQQMVKATDVSPDPGREIDYPAEQLLASATNPGGVIRYANEEFCQTAGFPLENLIGSPHKIVRHRDMPRGLFHLMWAKLKAGVPVCTYVKNATRDADFYWVFATVTQMRDGFLSVRIKPTSNFFDMTRELYDDLLKEEARGLSPEKSAERFLAALSEKGFEDFDAYTRAALDAEFEKRSDIGQLTDTSLGKIAQLTGLMDQADELVQKIITIFQQVGGEPVNLRILSGRLEGAGVAIGTISKNYETMADDMYQMIERLRCDETGLLVRMRQALASAHVSSQIAALINLTEQQAAAKPSAESGDQEGWILLSQQAESLNETSRAAVAEVVALGKIIPDVCRQLRRRINGLDLVKLLCRVESGRMSDVDSGLTGIIRRLEEAHLQTDRHLAALSGIAFQIDSTSKAL